MINNLTNLKDLNKLLILIHIGVPIMYFALFIKFNTPIFYIISLIYVLLPVFIIINKKTIKKSLSYNYEINDFFKTQLIFAASTIVSVMWITYIKNNIQGHQDYGSGLLIIFILFVNIVSWFIFMGLLVKKNYYLNSKKTSNYE